MQENTILSPDNFVEYKGWDIFKRISQQWAKQILIACLWAEVNSG